MQKLNEQYVIDSEGKTAGVLLDIRSYQRLMRHLEDLEDALDLDEARRTATTSRPYDAIRADLEKAGRL